MQASRAFLPSLKVVPLECGTPAVLVELAILRDELQRGVTDFEPLPQLDNF
ncbi:MAG: hypothetical protein JGK38_28525 [Microcoleus sp. PH2017_15_JOR_U_A]|nr:MULTISPECIES: hypothetical protein [unclassified Microcoleus]MCC3506623.1 hypothetical protein [Microcoleus sp. PH2017_19_SFW_U_A]MCC3473860.1 hypothetical protein [Microcoleus sp. PH2017_13_LAR_U_A]MCC3486297.1 hypothetical protein [Microcoleus sp. PH2017_14_LAR_D_A]MCC3500480.1 hypothetical protein [Microcoleus sp. PH2017_15_JOR_U_A]MCC3525985.1 hypothetical protein [Microcoleus sp. PH2017_20_SFW_D_A]